MIKSLPRCVWTSALLYLSSCLCISHVVRSALFSFLFHSFIFDIVIRSLQINWDTIRTLIRAKLATVSVNAILSVPSSWISLTLSHLALNRVNGGQPPQYITTLICLVAVLAVIISVIKAWLLPTVWMHVYHITSCASDEVIEHVCCDVLVDNNATTAKKDRTNIHDHYQPVIVLLLYATHCGPVWHRAKI